jgi:chromosomal replication initiator protein
LARQHDLDQTWAQIQSSLRSSFPESTYQIWLAELQPTTIDEMALFVEVPDETRDWVRRRFGTAISKAAREADPSIQRVELLAAHRESGPGVAASKRRESPPSEISATVFKPAYTFDRFVIGKTNHFAHAAALAAAEMPGHAYNPLVIHGPPGVGKTHLLQAVGNYLTTHDANLSVHYTTIEGFTGDFTRALKQNTGDSFKSTYRCYDALLVDDLQSLEGKPKTTQEFFHTFDSLITNGAQIVIASDRDPSQTPFLEPRFKERLQAGLTINLASPNQSTRLAILRKLVALNEAEIPAEVVAHLADRITSNVRALEGALIRIVAFASLSESKITTELADRVLANLYSDHSQSAKTTPKPDATQIQAETAAVFGLHEADLASPGRSRPVVYARQIAMYLCRELAGLSYPEIARHFGRRDHTTALHACRKMKTKVLSDHATRTLVTTITDALYTSPHSTAHTSSTPRSPTARARGNVIHNPPTPNHNS